MKFSRFASTLRKLILDLTKSFVTIFWISRYDKVHLFDMELPDKKLKLKESDYVEPGAALAELVDSPVGKIGLGIVSHTIQFYLFFISMIYL